MGTFYSNHFDEKQDISCLEKSDVYDKIKSLDNGINTSLYKNFEEDGIELSGGENQKNGIYFLGKVMKKQGG